MRCPQCASKNIVKNGYYKSYQKYKCKDCNRQFSERSFSFFYRHRFPEEIIKNSILFTLFVSTRNAKFLISETAQFYPSHVSIYNWVEKFAFLLSKQKRVMAFSNIWHVDEKFVKVKGSKDDFAYLWVVMDDHNNIIAVYVSERRDYASARTILSLAKQTTKKPPDIIVSDGLQSL